MGVADRNEARRLHVLVSYAYWQGGAALAELERMPAEWNVVLDSGAFTTFTQGQEATRVEDYIAFCGAHAERFWRIINLDRIGDPHTSHHNMEQLLAAGVPAMPVFQRGDELASLLRMREEAFPVCIGGISQNVGATAEQRYMRQVLTFCRENQIRVHLLGVGGPALFRLPCWSGDSSSWTMPNRFGQLQLWDGRGRMVSFRRGRLQPTTELTSLLTSYDLTWADLRDRRQWSVGGWSDPTTRASRVYIASVRSYMRLALALTRLDRRYVFAVDPRHVGVLEAGWELEKHKWQR